MIHPAYVYSRIIYMHREFLTRGDSSGVALSVRSTQPRGRVTFMDSFACEILSNKSGNLGHQEAW